MKITERILIVGAGCNAENAVAWLSSVQEACDKFGISSSKAISAFLANVGVESGGFSVLVENLNYSAPGLARTWPSRFAVDPKATAKTPNTKALALANKPQDIANEVYANRLGNGGPESGDGWRYRGQGPIQITGKANMVACMMAIDLPVVEHPELLQEPGAGAMSAAWFFVKQANCLPPADRGDFDAVVKLINGAPPGPANSGALRLARYNASLREFE